MRIDTLPTPTPPALPFESVRIGLLALATDLNSEADLRRMLPSDVGLYSNRVQHENPMSLEALQRVADDLPRAGRDLLPGIELDVLVYGCTSGTIAHRRSRNAGADAARAGVASPDDAGDGEPRRTEQAGRASGVDAHAVPGRGEPRARRLVRRHRPRRRSTCPVSRWTMTTR